MEPKKYGAKLLSINSTILEIMQEYTLNERSMPSIAQEMGVSVRSLTNVLKKIGFEYDSTFKNWRFTWLSSDDYRNCSFYSIQQGVAKPIPFDYATLNKDDMSYEKDNTMNINQTFTPSEIDALKQLAQQFMDNPTTSAVNGTEYIGEAIKRIPTGDNSRRTFVVPNELLDQLDAFCDANKVQRSQFLSVAIADALAKYK